MLGAVRRPDRIFDTYTSTKCSARSVSQLEDSKAVTLASLHQETAQAKAHSLWPIAVAHQAASTVSRLASAAKAALQKPDEAVPAGTDLYNLY